MDLKLPSPRTSVNDVCVLFSLWLILPAKKTSPARNYLARLTRPTEAPLIGSSLLPKFHRFRQRWHRQHFMRMEATALYQRRWHQLQDSLRTQQQLIGVAAVACGATHSIMERCNFSCTSCYLSDIANATQAAPFHVVRAQLDDLRRHLGPGGKCQITSGEVTLLPVEDLGRIVAHARKIGLDPMVMTNGHRFLQQPEYLHRLVVDYGLAKVSFHVDVTQKGRPGWRSGLPEISQHALRDRCATLVRETRRITGQPLHGAMTVTVTDTNTDGIQDITRWALANADAIRILSFQPVAPVGRTQDTGNGATNDTGGEGLTLQCVWRHIGSACGNHELNDRALQFGHPDCNITSPVLVVDSGIGAPQPVEIARREKRWDRRIVRLAIRQFSRHIDLNHPWRMTLRRTGAILAPRPWMLLELSAYGIYRLWGERRLLTNCLQGLFRGHLPSVRPLLLVIHSFMGAAELQTSLGQQRLAACVFLVPVNGEMVSMCQVNASGLRRQLNEAQRRQRPMRLATGRVEGANVAPTATDSVAIDSTALFEAAVAMDQI